MKEFIQEFINGIEEFIEFIKRKLIKKWMILPLVGILLIILSKNGAFDSLSSIF